MRRREATPPRPAETEKETANVNKPDPAKTKSAPRRNRALAGLLALVAAAVLALPAAALGAGPELSVELSHSPGSIARNDEFINYEIKVKNVAPRYPNEGDTLTCDGASSPLGTKIWFGEPQNVYSFSFQWTRNGAPITAWVAGAAGTTHTVAAADAGAALQCLVKGTNADGSGSFLTASQSALVAAPAPAVEAPKLVAPVTNGSRRPAIAGPLKAGTESTSGAVWAAGEELRCTAPTENWSIVATADTETGSKVLKAVTTAKGTGTTTVGSSEITVLKRLSGNFQVGQTVSIAGVTFAGGATTTIAEVGEASLVFASPVASGAGNGKAITAGSQPFAAGEEIRGNGIPAGTMIESVSGREIILTEEATATAPGVAVQSAASGTWSFEWLRDGEAAPGAVTTPTPVTSNYTLTAADVSAPDAPSVFQCLAKATNPGGAAVVESTEKDTKSPAPAFGAKGSANFEPFQGPDQVPVLAFENGTSGNVELEFELPPGDETRAFSVATSTGSAHPRWTCGTHEPIGLTHGKVACVSTKPAAPQVEYYPIEIGASIGASTPDPALAKATVSGGGAPTVSAEDSFGFGPAIPFEIESFATKVADSLGNDYTQAGGHPFSAGAEFKLPTRIGPNNTQLQIGFGKNLITDLPPGFVGNAEATQRCSGTAAVYADTYANPTCPWGSIVGFATVELGNQGGHKSENWPVYAIEPERGTPAQFEFFLKGVKDLISLTPRLRAAEGYAISVDAPKLSKNPVVLGVSVTLCGFGVNLQASPVGGEHIGAPEAVSCKPRTQAGAEPANPKPFLTNPSTCEAAGPMTKLSLDSWEYPGALKPDGSPDYSDPDWHSKEAGSPPLSGCSEVPFDPSIDLQPTGHQADSPTGLDVLLSLPTDGLESPTDIAQAFLRKARVTLPAGMAVNPAATDGLGACTSAQIGLGTNDPVSCPDSSKVGSADATTPILGEPLKGSVYLAKQFDNPFHSLLALYLVLENEERGIRVKLPGKVEADPSTGQIVSTFDNNPQAPIGSVSLHFNSGNRAALLAPPKCGHYQIVSELTPWSGAAEPTASTRTIGSSFTVNRGPNGSPCPAPDLDPKLSAGLANPVAGSSSPFLTELSREDGTKRIDSLDLKLPPGLVAYLKGLGYCSDASLASVSEAEGTGQDQIDHPACPQASQIGTVSVKAGGGSNPYYVSTPKVYLAGPYKGAPLSIAVIAPAVAGPFDLGSVVVRNAAYIDPVTAQITVKSDPIPTILHGIPIDLRDVRVNVDRPDFTLAPTNCEEMAVGATVGGEGQSKDLSERFQVGACSELGFAPHLKLRLRGGTKRAANPKLIANLSAREGDANLAALSVRLPRSAFLDQSHIRTICTRVQWAADACPKGSIYGDVSVKTPLLDYTLKGHVYLRSSVHKLPDLITDLRGPSYQPIRVELSGKTDSVKGALRNTFSFIPDAPFTQARLVLYGGKRGLVVNSRDICAHTYRATVTMDGQNGKIHDFRPVVRNGACGKARRKHRRHHGRHHHRRQG